MRTRASVICSALAASTIGIGLVSGATTVGAESSGRPFRLELSGANEFNAAGAPINPHGDADRGSMTLTLNPGRQQVCWTVGALTLTAGDALPHVAHIHEAPAGVAGPVVIDLFGGASTEPAPTSYPSSTSCVSAERTLIREIMHDPSAYYVNLHNVQHPGGVMRSQLDG